MIAESHERERRVGDVRPASATRAVLWRFAVVFSLGVGVVFALLALRYLAVAPPVSGFAASAFRASMFVTQAIWLAFVLVLLVAPVVAIFPRPRVVVPVAVGLSTVALALVLVDTFVYRQYRFHLDASVWRLLTDGGAETTFHMPRSTLVELGAIVLGLLVVLAAWARFAWRRAEKATLSRFARRVAVVLALAVFVHNVAHAWASAAAYTPVTRQVGLLPLHRPATARRVLARLGIEVARAPFDVGREASGLLYPRAPLAFAPPARRENVCLVVVDSWRADALTPRVTPNLWRVAEESVRFTEHHSGGNATRIGMFSLFYGLPGTYWHDVHAERRACVLVEEFQRQGYEIAVFRSAPLSSPEFDATIFHGVPDLRMRSRGDGPAQCDRDLTDDFLAWLGKRDASRPFFTLLFYDAPHAYDVPDDFAREFEPSWPRVDYLALDGETEREPFENLYKNSVRWSDSQAGRAIDALRERDLLDETFLVVTGDHGQEFDDLGLAYWGHNSNFARFQSHVPMLVRRKGLAPGARDHLTSHFDVATTILSEVLGCTSPPADYCVGRDLFDAADRGVLTLATWSTWAAVRPGVRHVVVGRAGEIEVLGRDYRPEPWTELDARFLEESLRQRARFRPGAAGL